WRRPPLGKLGNSVNTRTRRPDCAYGRGRRSTAFTTLKIAVVAPIPRARQATAEAVKPGFLARRRTAYRTSCGKADMALRRGGGGIVLPGRYSALPATMIAIGRSPTLTLRTVSCSPSLVTAGNVEPEGGSREKTAACAVPLVLLWATSFS